MKGSVFTKLFVRQCSSVGLDQEFCIETSQSRFVDTYLLYLLAAASDKASAQFHAHVRKAGLRVPEWRALACLYENEGMMITELAELSLMEQSRMTRIIDQMDQRKLVSRFSDGVDRRKVRVKLTDEGKALASRLVEDAKRHEANLLSDLADTDAAKIKAVLQALLSKLGS